MKINLIWVLLIFNVPSFARAKEATGATPLDVRGDQLAGCPQIAGLPTTSGRAYLKSVGKLTPLATNIDLLPGMNEAAAGLLIASGFDVNKPTVVYSHGWQETAEIGWLQTIRERYATQYPPGDKPFNLLLLDWSQASHYMYPQAVRSAPVLGQRLGSFLNTLNTTYNYPMDNLHLVGFSLSTHIMGAAAKEIQKDGNQVKLLTALDSAGPCFYTSNPFAQANTLSSDVAEQVITRHYGDDKYGARRPVGGVDIYVNGGRNQPSSLAAPSGRQKRDIPDMAGLKDHMSTEFHEYNTVVERSSPSSCQSVAYKCDSYARFIQGSCGKCDAPADCYHIGTFEATENIQNASALQIPSNTKMYIQTAPGQRCLYHYQVIVEAKSGASQSTLSALNSGRAQVDLGSGAVASLRGRTKCENGSTAYTALVTSPNELRTSSASTRSVQASDLASVRINYMSHSDKSVRDAKSRTLCPSSSGNKLAPGSCQTTC